MLRKTLSCALLFVCVVVVSAQADIFKVRIPSGIEPAKVTLICGQYGHGLGLQQETRRMGNDFLIDIFPAERSEIGATTRVKLLIFCPGYRVVTADLDVAKGETSKLFAPVFSRVPMLPIKIRLEGTSGQPRAGQGLTLRISLGSHEYFGYGDGMAFMADIAKGATDSRGEFAAELPSLLDDPYFAGWKRGTPGFEVSLPGDHGSDQRYGLVSRSIPAQRSYAGALVMKVVEFGRLYGSVARELLAKHGIDLATADKEKYSLYLSLSRRGGGRGTKVNRDGSYSLTVPPETYDLRLTWQEKFADKYTDIWTTKGVTIAENEQKKLLIE